MRLPANFMRRRFVAGLMLGGLTTVSGLWQAVGAARNDRVIDVLLEAEGDNQVSSPLGLALALDVLRASAAGATREELDRLLSAAVPSDVFGMHHASFIVAPGSTIAPAFSRWISVHPGARLFDSTRLGFATELAAWVRERTQGIVGTVDERAPSPGCILLGNVVATSQRWRTPFPVERTAHAPFRGASGRQRDVPMMRQVLVARVGDLPEAEVVTLPLEGDFVAVAILPRRGDPAAALRSAVTQVASGTLIGRPTLLEVMLPRFTLQESRALRPALVKHGMRRAFDLAQADFTAGFRVRPLAVEAVEQLTNLAVGEAGVVASAVTRVDMITSAPVNADLRRVVFDRPFALLLADLKAGTVGWVAVVREAPV